MSTGEEVIASFIYNKEDTYVLASKNGMIKRTASTDFEKIHIIIQKVITKIGMKVRLPMRNRKMVLKHFINTQKMVLKSSQELLMATRC